MQKTSIPEIVSLAAKHLRELGIHEHLVLDCCVYSYYPKFVRFNTITYGNENLPLISSYSVKGNNQYIVYFTKDEKVFKVQQIINNNGSEIVIRIDNQEHKKAEIEPEFTANVVTSGKYFLIVSQEKGMLFAAANKDEFISFCNDKSVLINNKTDLPESIWNELRF